MDISRISQQGTLGKLGGDGVRVEGKRNLGTLGES